MERRLFLNMLLGAGASVGLRSYVDLGACVTRFEGTVSYDQVIAVTLKAYQREMEMLISAPNPFLARLIASEPAFEARFY